MDTGGYDWKGNASNLLLLQVVWFGGQFPVALYGRGVPVEVGRFGDPLRQAMVVHIECTPTEMGRGVLEQAALGAPCACPGESTLQLGHAVTT